MLNDPLLLLVIGACLLVLMILGVGIGTFGRGRGIEASKRSNKLMQYRIAAQFVAVALILAMVWLWNRGG